MKKQQSGFTLIELIIVIVILGILAVTAAPRFIDVSSDATASTLQGVRAALKGGADLVFAKSAIAGDQATAAAAGIQVSINGANIPTNFGYPNAEGVTAGTLAGWVDISAAEFTLVPTADSGDDTFAIVPGAEAPADFEEDTCHVLYTQASESASPLVTVNSDGC